MGIRHLAHVLSVPPTKACLLCATPAGMDLYRQAMPVGTYQVQSPGFPKIVYCDTWCLSEFDSGDGIWVYSYQPEKKAQKGMNPPQIAERN